MAFIIPLADAEAFVRRILEQPEKTEARLVYADFIEERGNQKADELWLEELLKPGEWAIISHLTKHQGKRSHRRHLFWWVKGTGTYLLIGPLPKTYRFVCGTEGSEMSRNCAKVGEVLNIQIPNQVYKHCGGKWRCKRCWEKYQ